MTADATGCRNIYFIGIAGTAMGSAAVALKNAGYAVTGVDENVYPPMSSVLAENGILFHEGFDAAHLDLNPDLVVIGNAMSRGNPEVERTLAAGIPYMSLPELIGQFFIGDKHSFVVTGTHGKSTTTSLLAWIFEYAGREPGWLIGGVPANLPANCRFGGGNEFIIEGDEYDTAFFDKRSKFMHYHPRTVILNNIELDHVDIFLNLDDIVRSFRNLLTIVPADGRIIANIDDPNVRRLAESHPVIQKGIVPCVTYGTAKDADYRITSPETGEEGLSFTIAHEGKDVNVHSRLFGVYQLYNATAAAAAALEHGIDADTVCGAVAEFRGLKRRMEVRGEVNGITVIDDFAHHPTAIAGTIEAARRRFPGRRIVAVFEPRSNTMRRNIFQGRIRDALAGADVIALSAVHQPERVAEGERLDPGMIVNELRDAGKEALLFSSTEEIVGRLVRMAKPGDVILGMSNGGFGGFYDALLASLA